MVATGLHPAPETIRPRKAVSQGTAAPAATAAPVQPAAEPAPADPAPAAAEPGLFQGLENGSPQPEAPAAAPADDLPPPAYQPAAAAPQQEAGTRQPPAPGTASPDTMDRLRAAVQKAPEQAGFSTRRDAPGRAAQGDRPRFGINSLIGRMTGQGAEPSGPSQAARPQPPVSSAEPEPAADPEQERIEIPAFLRRQAN